MPRSVPLALTLLCLAACGKSNDGGEPTPPPAASAGEPGTPEPTPAPEPAPAPAMEFDEAVYHFQDASVPPQHHRSVTITAKAGSIVRVVDSYGEEIERAEGTLAEGGLAKLAAVLADGKVRTKPEEEGVATAKCAGGTSETVTLRNGGKDVFVGIIDHCGGGDTPDFEGDLGPFIAALKALASSGPAQGD